MRSWPLRWALTGKRMTALFDQLEAPEWWRAPWTGPVPRTMREFAEAEIVLPDGPHKGQPFRCDTQPFAALLLDELDSGRWRRVAVVGPAQSGKTLVSFVIVTLYILFELGESTIVGIPDMNMADDKWRIDLLPVIKATRYADLLPDKGPGSRGGRVVNTVEFGNGAVLKFMSGGGSDAKRSGYTSRTVQITETDKLDEVGGKSREADKVAQFEARTGAFADAGEVVMESTASFTTGRIWREFLGGTASRIVKTCPHCGESVTPEREHLKGWQEAASEVEARAKAYWVCPSCDEPINDEQRVEMCRGGRLIHKGDGEPDVVTLGFRYSGFDNLLQPTPYLAAGEWRAKQAPDDEIANRERKQFTWAMPHDPPKLEDSGLAFTVIRRRVADSARGMVPAEFKTLVCGCDIGKWLLHWVAVAFDEEGSGRVVEYAEIEVPASDMREELAILLALREFRDLCQAGWLHGKETITPACVLVDAGNWDSTAYAFVRESGPPFWPAKGFGARQIRAMPADGYRVGVDEMAGIELIEIDADKWKGFAYEGLKTPPDEAGAITLFAAEHVEHTQFAKHCCAEAPVTEFKNGREVTRFKDRRRANHYWDALYMACCAGHIAGVRLLEPERPKPKGPPPSPSRTPTQRRRPPMRRAPLRRTYG